VDEPVKSLAGSYSFNQRPDTLMQDHHRQIDETSLRRTAGPYICAKSSYGRIDGETSGGPNHSMIAMVLPTILGWSLMAESETKTAKILKHGRGQAVLLPKEFRLPGTAVRLRRVGRAILLEPLQRTAKDIDALFAEIDRLDGADFLREGRPEQPTHAAWAGDVR
jgi:antitoxin VapB